MSTGAQARRGTRAPLSAVLIGVALLAAPLVAGCGRDARADGPSSDGTAVPGTGTAAAVPGTGPTEGTAAGSAQASAAAAALSAHRVTTRNERGTIRPGATYIATVPMLSGPDKGVVTRVNTAIDAYVRQEKNQTYDATLTLTAGTPHVGRQVLAVSFAGDRFAAGMAHPATLASGLVFDLRTGAQVHIGDVFTDTDAGLRRLESIVRPALEQRFPGGPTGGVTDPVPANYQQFVVNPKGLVVIVADLPYVLGPQSVLADWDKLTGLVRPDLAAALRS